MVSGSCALPPRWPTQCSCVVIESSFDPGELLQAPVSLWFNNSEPHESSTYSGVYRNGKQQNIDIITRSIEGVKANAKFLDKLS